MHFWEFDPTPDDIPLWFILVCAGAVAVAMMMLGRTGWPT